MAMVCAIIIMACSTNDDDPDSDLIGIWELSEFKAQCNTSNESSSEKANGGCIEIDGDRLCASITFRENGTGVFTTSGDGFDELGEMTYTLNGNQINLCDGDDCNAAFLRNDQLTVEWIEEDCEVEYIFSEV